VKDKLKIFLQLLLHRYKESAKLFKTTFTMDEWNKSSSKRIW